MEKWKSDKWFTSQWNYAEEVRKNFAFPDKIKFHDVTLRDGEQQVGITFTKDDKIDIAEKLMELGIHRIEAGLPAVSRDDEEAVRQIVKRAEKTDTEVFAFSRCVRDDVLRAADCGVKGIVIEIPSSQHIIEKAYLWPLEKAISQSIEATSLAKEKGLYTVFFPIDMTRADIDWVLKMIKRVAAEGHMDALALVDTFGVLVPQTVPYFIGMARKAIADKPLETHFHDDFGLGTANTLMALAAGAEVAHTTLMGVGERCGNAAYEEVALALLVLYGIDTGIKFDRMHPTDQYFKKLAGISMKENKGVLGENIFQIHSGIVAGIYKNIRDNDVLELFPYLPELTGHKDFGVVLGKLSGAASVDMWLEKVGRELSDNDKDRVLLKIKEQALQKRRLLTEEEFIGILDSLA